MGFARMLHGGSSNRRKPQVQIGFGERRYVVSRMATPMLLIEGKSLVQALEYLSDALTQLRV